MSRRLSGSAEDTDNCNPLAADSPIPSSHGEKGSFTSAKYEMRNKSDTLDRRKFERSIGFTHLPPDGPTPSSANALGTTKRSLPFAQGQSIEKMPEPRGWRRTRLRSPWACSLPTLIATALAIALLVSIIHAFVTRQLDPKGCDMCWSRPIYIKFSDFDTEHTRFASKYHLYLHRDGAFDEDPKVKGVPVLFIPGNAGSFRQARCLAVESAQYFQSMQQEPGLARDGVASLDFFAIDFNEDLSAFHGQTILDQAEYLNDAVAYILSLYHDPRRSQRDSSLPDPSSVILVGHSMGGVIARTMLTMPNYQSNSINTIITMSAPHARAPVSVDAEMVHTYQRVNDYWRQAYSQKWANDNPLWHVTLVSVAGGGLDTVVSSDYASLESLVPSTHGFTVFTSGIPNVWTGADHIQTTWCVQLMIPIVRSIMDSVDVRRPSQTKPRAERMRIFQKWYLTGMEDVVEKTLPQQEPSTVLTLENNNNTVVPLGRRLVMRDFGDDKKPKAYLLPIPPQDRAVTRKFTLLTEQKIDHSGDGLEVLFCNVFPLQPGQSSTLLSMNMDLSGDTSGSGRLACRSAASDVIHLPASLRESVHPFDKAPPFSYLQYSLSDLVDYKFAAVIDKTTEPRRGWAVTEFSATTDSIIETNVGLRRLLAFGLHFRLPADRPLVTEVRIPALHSSLLSFSLSLGEQACGEDVELFTPLLRQYLQEPHESKFFVNVKNANISLHGIAPFMPPPLRAHGANDGVSLQFWTDPTCNSSIDVNLKVDIPGSLGKLVMRYRTVFAAFPLLIVALVLRKQFKLYDETGIFITFAESMDLCLRSSLPLLIMALSFAALSLAISSTAPPKPSSKGLFGWGGNATESAIDFTQNDLLLGSQDPIFWFLVPLFGLISVGVCVLVNYAALALTNLFYLPYNYLTARPAWVRVEDISGRSIAPAFAPSSPRRRIITTCVLLFLVSTFIPYQFAYLDAVLVQIATCTRALRLDRASHSPAHHNFYNYTHSILILMLWILPINLPVLIVWVHNLAIHWLTPFSSHHNLISVAPYLVLVETLTCGKMIPRVTTRWRHVTSVGFFGMAVYSAVYGVSYAYMLHYVGNVMCLWLAGVHFSQGEVSWGGLRRMLEGEEGGEGGKKRP